MQAKGSHLQLVTVQLLAEFAVVFLASAVALDLQAPLPSYLAIPSVDHPVPFDSIAVVGIEPSAAVVPCIAVVDEVYNPCLLLYSPVADIAAVASDSNKHIDFVGKEQFDLVSSAYNCTKSHN